MVDNKKFCFENIKFAEYLSLEYTIDVCFQVAECVCLGRYKERGGGIYGRVIPTQKLKSCES